MGHVRLGRLPKTQRWRQVVDLLTTSTDDIGVLADATATAAERRLRQLRNDASFAYCFWLLTRISWASRGEDFPGALAESGIQVRGDAGRHPEDHLGPGLLQLLGLLPAMGAASTRV